MLDPSDIGETPVTFSGTEEGSIDDKYRLLISKKKRERLGDNFVLVLSEIGSIAAYPKATWAATMAEISKVYPINVGRMQYGRLVVGTAVEDVNCDGQGRMVIPSNLRQSAKIVDKVVVVGAIEKVEIWAKDEWEKYQADPGNYGSERLGHIVKAIEQMRAN